MKLAQKKRFLLCLARRSLYVFFPGLAPRGSINHSFPFLQEALCRGAISANKILQAMTGYAGPETGAARREARATSRRRALSYLPGTVVIRAE